MIMILIFYRPSTTHGTVAEHQTKIFAKVVHAVIISIRVPVTVINSFYLCLYT